MYLSYFKSLLILDGVVCRLALQNGLFNLKGATGGINKAVGYITVTDADLVEKDSQFDFRVYCLPCPPVEVCETTTESTVSSVSADGSSMERKTCCAELGSGFLTFLLHCKHLLCGEKWEERRIGGAEGSDSSGCLWAFSKFGMAYLKWVDFMRITGTKSSVYPNIQS